MSKITTAIRLLRENKNEFFASLVKNTGFLLSDSRYLILLFKYKVGYPLHLDNPQTYNEKLQWIKLYYHRPEMSTMVDKYSVKDYVANKIGGEYIIPTLGVWNDAKNIEWDKLPNQFVLKTTNGGGSSGVVICKDKSKIDIPKIVKSLNSSLKFDIYKEFREWPYKDVKARVIAEEYLEEKDKTSLTDYKVMCFDGKVKLIEYHEGRYTSHHTQDFYDRDWNLTKITQGRYGEFNKNPSPKPALLDEMIRLSEILAEGLPHVRVDWYIVDNHLYFGELTFFDGSGLCPWDRYEDDLLMGSWITLPKKTVESEDRDLGIRCAEMFY